MDAQATKLCVRCVVGNGVIVQTFANLRDVAEFARRAEEVPYVTEIVAPCSKAVAGMKSEDALPYALPAPVSSSAGTGDP